MSAQPQFSGETGTPSILPSRDDIPIGCSACPPLEHRPKVTATPSHVAPPDREPDYDLSGPRPHAPHPRPARLRPPATLRRQRHSRRSITINRPRARHQPRSPALGHSPICRRRWPGRGTAGHLGVGARCRGLRTRNAPRPAARLRRTQAPRRLPGRGALGRSGFSRPLPAKRPVSQRHHF
jgi:hypothetical protein